MATQVERAPRTLPERKGGINKKLAAFALTGVIAAGGIGIWAASQKEQTQPEPTPIAGGIGNPNPTETPTMTVTPTEAPTPIVTAAPTKTPEITAEPTPIVKPNNLASIIELTPTKIATSTVKTSLETAWNNVEKLQTDGSLKELMQKWDYCTGKADIGIATDPVLNKELGCRGLIYYLSLIKDTNNSTNIDPYTYQAAKDIFNFAETTLPSPYKEDLIKFLKQF